MGEVTKERPILFSGPMVKAILSGKKTMTRRVVNPQPVFDGKFWRLYGAGWSAGADSVPCVQGHSLATRNPYGQVGDRLWVRETFAPIPADRPAGYFTNRDLIGKNYWYRATDSMPTWGGKWWKPSIFMPKEASRITLEITSISIERLQEITGEDAIAEGFESVEEFRKLWDSINAKRGVCKTCKGHGVVLAWSGSVEGGSLARDAKDCPDCEGRETGYRWDNNPWAWVVEFKTC